MTGAFGLAMTQAVLSFRSLPLGKPVNKLVHTFWHTVAFFCIGFGLAAIFRSHDREKNNPNPNLPPGDNYIANLYSPHSIVGIAVVSAAAFQYLTGLLAILITFESFGLDVGWIKKALLPNHVLFGIFIYAGGILSICAGTAEVYFFTQRCSYYNNQVDKSFFNDDGAWKGANSYTLKSPDDNPAEKYLYLPDGCKVSVGLGISALLTLLFVVFGAVSIKAGAESDGFMATTQASGFVDKKDDDVVVDDLDEEKDKDVEPLDA